MNNYNLNKHKFLEDKLFGLKLLLMLTISIIIPFISNTLIIAGIITAIIFLYISTGYGIIKFISDIKIMISIFLFSCLILIFFKYIQFKELCIITAKMIILLSIFSIFLRTTNINNLIVFLQKFCRQDIVFALCVSLKFIPLLLKEIKEIYYLQKNRGIKLKFKNFINGTFFLSIIVPFIIISLKIINNLNFDAYIKKLDLNQKRSNIYQSEKLKYYYFRRDSL